MTLSHTEAFPVPPAHTNQGAQAECWGRTFSCCKALAMTGWLDVCSWRRVRSPSMDCWKVFLWLVSWADCMTTSKRLSTWEENQARGLKTDPPTVSRARSIPSPKTAPTSSGRPGQEPRGQKGVGEHSCSLRWEPCAAAGTAAWGLPTTRKNPKESSWHSVSQTS